MLAEDGGNTPPSPFLLNEPHGLRILTIEPASSFTLSVSTNPESVIPLVRTNWAELKLGK